MPHLSCGHASAPAKGAHAPLRISRRQSSRAVCQRLPRRRPHQKRAAAPTSCSQAATPAAIPTRPLSQPSRQQGAAVLPAPAPMQRLLQAAVGVEAPGRAAPGRPLHTPAPTRHLRVPAPATAASVHPQQPAPTRCLRAPAPAATASHAARNPTSTLLSAAPAGEGTQAAAPVAAAAAVTASAGPAATAAAAGNRKLGTARGDVRRSSLKKQGARVSLCCAEAAWPPEAPSITECMHMLHSTHDLAVSDVQR